MIVPKRNKNIQSAYLLNYLAGRINNFARQTPKIDQVKQQEKVCLN